MHNILLWLLLLPAEPLAYLAELDDLLVVAVGGRAVLPMAKKESKTSILYVNG